ncbi:MAG: hypothetical protein DRQ42_09170, partial [Gammaproteobacteria bacterium]
VEQYGQPLADEPVTNMNFERAEYPEDIHGLLDELQRVEDGRGNMEGRTTFDEIKAEGRAETWEGIQKSYDEGTPLNRGQISKLREIDQAMWRDFQPRIAEYKDKQMAGSISAQEEFEFRRTLARVGVISNYLMGEKRRLAQSMAALRDTPDNVHMSKLQRDEYLDIMNREMPFDELLDSLSNAKNAGEFKKLATGDKWYKKFARIGGNVWFNAVLSMWAPAKAAIGGAVINKFIFPMETLYAAGVGKISQMVFEKGGRGHLDALNRQVVASEAILEFAGGFQGLRDSLPAIWKQMQDPEFDLGPVKFDRKVSAKDTLHGNFGDKGLGWNVATQAVDWFSQNGSRRTLSMVDFAVRSVTSQQKTMALAFRVAVNEGLEGPALKSRVKEILNDMPDEIFNEQLLAGKQATMTQELSGKLKKLSEVANIVPGGAFVMPFMKTMSAMVELGVERTPGIAFASKAVRAEMAKGGASRDKAIGKQLFGMTLMGIGWVSAMNGSVTSGTTQSNREKGGLRKGGYAENSMVTANGDHYSPNFMSPAFEMVFFGAALWEMSHYMNAGLRPSDPRYKDWGAVISEMSAGAGWTYADMMLNKSVGQGAREMLMAMDDPSRYGKRKSTSIIVPFLTPGYGTKHIRRIKDETRRRIPEGATYMQELWDAARNNLPGLSDSLPEQIGFFGESKPDYSLLDSFSWSPTNENAEAFQALQQNGIVPQMPRNVMQFPGAAVNLDTDLLPDSYTEQELADNPEMSKRGYAYMRWSQIKGEALKVAINMVIKSEMYNKTMMTEIDGESVEVPVIPYGRPNESGTGGTKGDMLVKAMRIAVYGMKGEGGALRQFQAEMNGKLKDLPEITRKIREERQPGITEFTDPGIEKVVASNKASDKKAEQAEIEAYQRKQEGVSF